jgi:hypothetical protein
MQFYDPRRTQVEQKKGGKGPFSDSDSDTPSGRPRISPESLPAIWRDLSYGPFRGFSGFRRGCGFWKILDEAGN